MLDSRSVARALATAEMRFILISSVLFCLVFIPVSGIDSSAELKRRAAQGIGVSLVINSFTVLDIFPRPDSNLSPGHQGFWGFFTFNTASTSHLLFLNDRELETHTLFNAVYSYIGQLFMCSVRGRGTAQILASIFIGINNFFSGLIVRPQQMSECCWPSCDVRSIVRNVFSIGCLSSWSLGIHLLDQPRSLCLRGAVHGRLLPR